MRICHICGQEVLDSRGNPTVQAKVVLEDGSEGRASVPSGASTGEYEAVELRDGGERYLGKGVRRAVENIDTVIAKTLTGMDACSQRQVDSAMLQADGTPNKGKLGANAILAVSLACAKAAAASRGLPLYRYLGGVYGNVLPTPMLNILNGGAHANNNVDIQEFMLYPVGFSSFQEKMEASVKVYHTLKGIIKGTTAVGDEGGFAPDLEQDEEAIQLILAAVAEAGYQPDKHFVIAIDGASSEWYRDGAYHLPKAGKSMSTEELIQYWEHLCAAYPIFSIEDPLGENDWEGWETITKRLGGHVQLVGDDLFVTNTKRLQEGIKRKVGNSILIKPNQIGSLTETMDAIRMAQRAGYTTVISHRSGETADTSIADIAVAVNAGQIKTGAPARGERVEKYNRLLEIEKELEAARRA